MNIRNRAELSIAQGSLTNSKRPSTFIDGVYPSHATHGKDGCLFVGKKKYIDYVGGLGTNLLGYGNEQIAEAIFQQYLKGSTLSLSTELEVELAERLKGLFLFTDLWKFTKTGTEACNAALRIARAHTGRDLVLSEGYHGWGDDFVSMSPPALGIPGRDWINHLDFSLIAKAACVIVEPVVLEFGQERREFLERLRKECTKHGTVLIFDEIITGFRWPGYSVAKYFGIFPDIILLGKAIGGGLPLSAIGGTKDVMAGKEYFISGTFFGETCSMAASMKLLDIVHKDGSAYSMANLWEEGSKFLDKFNALHPQLKINGYPSRGAFVGDQTVKALFWQEAVKAGILFGPSWFFNFSLPDYTDTVITVSRDVFNRIDMGHVKLEGKMPQTPFAQRTRGLT